MVSRVLVLVMASCLGAGALAACTPACKGIERCRAGQCKLPPGEGRSVLFKQSLPAKACLECYIQNVTQHCTAAAGRACNWFVAA